MWGKRLAPTDEYLDKLHAVSLFEEACVTPLAMSPIKMAKFFSADLPDFSFDVDYEPSFTINCLPDKINCLPDEYIGEDSLLESPSTLVDDNYSFTNLSGEEEYTEEEDSGSSSLDSSLTVPDDGSSDESIIQDW